MFGKIWRWLKNLWQQLFGTPPQPSPPAGREQFLSPPVDGGVRGGKLRSDAEQESLFLQLLDMVAKGESRENIKRFLFGKLINEAELVAWLRRFGSKLLESPQNHRELARRMVRLDEVLGGELGKVAGGIGRELLGNSATISVNSSVDNQSVDTTNSVSDAVPVDRKAEEWYNRGCDEYDAGNIQAALSCFQKAIAISPNYHIAWNGLGNARKNLGQYPEAIEAYQKALDISPDDHIPWNNLGFARSDLGQYEKAIKAYQKALDISPDYHIAWNNLGADLNKLGQYQQAIQAYQKALDISPNNHYVWNGLGATLSDLEQYPEAIEAYQKALDISPDDHYVWNGLGNVRENLGQYQEAIDAFDRALEITHNQYWEAWANRGWAIYNLHGYQAALQNWDEGLQSLQPETRGDREGCAVLHQFKGDAHYRYGKRQPNPYPYWRESRNSYITALKTLSGSQTSILGEVLREQVSPRFQFQYLKILQDLAKVCNALNYQDDFQKYLDMGDTMLENVLLETESQDRKIQLANKFATFSQLRVVLLAQSSQLKEALLLAEKRKNLCLRWLRESRYVGIREETLLKYPEIEQFLSPGIAAIYWHYSPAAITTFIIKHDGIQIHPAQEPPSPNPFPRNGGRGEGEDEDNVINFPLQTEQDKNSLTPLPVAGRGWGWGSPVKQLQKFEDWLKEWKEEYQLNRKDAKEEKETWRDKMADRLDELGNILDIEPILKKLGDEITHLILIPHRDLHLLPLHYLFREKPLTITYLPSLKVGIELQNRQYNNFPAQLLSIEHPETQEPLLFAEIDAALIANFYSHPTPTRISGADATKNQVVAAMKNGADIFHFTGHGEHALNSPTNSALALTDEPLTLREIFDLPIPNYYLVCLSACETGLTNKSNLIDEFVGLVSGFLAKGTAYVLSTLWSVREDAAALMVVEFYRRLKAGATPPIAFQEAQNWLRTVTYPEIAEWYLQLATDELCQQDYGCWQNLRSLARNIEKDVDKMELSQPPYQNPYYWAGFTITGKV